MNAFLIIAFGILVSGCQKKENDTASSPMQWEYSVVEGTAILTRYLGHESEVKVPRFINGYPVVALSGKVSSGSVFSGQRLIEVTIPKGVLRIDNYAFSVQTNLKSVNLPNSLTHIGRCAFQLCSALTQIKIPEGVTNIGMYAFSCCFSLREISLPSSLSQIESKAFGVCSNLETILIPRGVTNIGASAFGSCARLIEIRVAPDNAYYASKEGVLYNKDLTLLVHYPGGKAGECIIPSSLQKIDYGSIGKCPKLNGFRVEGGNTNFTSDGGVLYNKDQSSLILFPRNNTGQAVLRPGITNIAPYAFAFSTNLIEVKLPDGLNHIGHDAFQDCKELSKINIPLGVTRIGTEAFGRCRNLVSLSLPEGISAIEEGTFIYCDKLADINIPSSVTRIGNVAFQQCTSLTNIIIPNGVTNIGYRAFGGCTSLTSVEIPISVKSIEKDAFRGCINLTNVSIPASLQEIGNGAFDQCPKLSSRVKKQINDQRKKD